MHICMDAAGGQVPHREGDENLCVRPEDGHEDDHEEHRVGLAHPHVLGGLHHGEGEDRQQVDALPREPELQVDGCAERQVAHDEE